VFALQAGDFAGDVLGFGFGVASFVKTRRGARAARGNELFADALLIVSDDGSGGIENLLARTVILLEADQARAGKIFGEAEEIGDVGAAPGINGLVFVADDAEIAVGADEKLK